MIRIALIYGGLAGLIVIAVISIGMSMAGGEMPEGGGSSHLVGYAVMILALTLVFFGIKRYRDKTLGGVISLGRAFMLGVTISGVAAIVYVLGWEAHLSATGYDFIAGYTAGIIESKRAAGVSGAELEAVIAKMETLEARYANPIYRLPMTFLEIFPVGLLVSIVSAFLLKNSAFMPARPRA